MTFHLLLFTQVAGAESLLFPTGEGSTTFDGRISGGGYIPSEQDVEKFSFFFFFFFSKRR
jgi:hypothetical protein